MTFCQKDDSQTTLKISRISTTLGVTLLSFRIFSARLKHDFFLNTKKLEFSRIFWKRVCFFWKRARILMILGFQISNFLSFEAILLLNQNPWIKIEFSVYKWSKIFFYKLRVSLESPNLKLLSCFLIFSQSQISKPYVHLIKKIVKKQNLIMQL